MIDPIYLGIILISWIILGAITGASYELLSGKRYHDSSMRNVFVIFWPFLIPFIIYHLVKKNENR